MIKTAAVTSSMCFSTSNLMSFKAGAIHSGICDTSGMTSSKTHASESWTCYCMFRGYLEAPVELGRQQQPLLLLAMNC